MDAAALERAAAFAAQGGRGAQLTVIRNGVVVLDRAIGCEPDSLFWLFSASKPYISVLAHRLAERGDVDLDAPIARVWPGYARRGKGAITLRQVLRHRTGMPTAGSPFGDALAMPSWRRTIRRIERGRPQLDPAVGPAYQFVIFGYIVGEALQRATGQPLVALLRREVLDPLGLDDTHLGLPREAWPRRMPLRFDPRGGTVAAAFLNRRRVREAVIPSAGISTTSAQLAAFYQALLLDAAGRGPGLLRPETLRTMTAPSMSGEKDQFARGPLRWAEGFQLGGPRSDSDRPSSLGRLTSSRTFGHNGSNCCIGWADPDRQLVVAYLTDRVPMPLAGVARLGELSDLIVAACR